MIRLTNYIAVVLVANTAVYLLRMELWFTLFFVVVLDCCLWAIFEYVDNQENVYLFSFIVSLPFILYWTDLANETADKNIFVLLATIFLCVSLPFVFILLFDLWRLAGED